MSKDTIKKEKKDQKSNFMKELRAELKKVTWPSRKELISNTVTVIVITLIVAAIVFVLDFGFEKLNTYGVGALKSIVTTDEEPETTTPVENTTTENTTVENVTTETPADANAATTEAPEVTAPEAQVTENPTAE